MTRYPLAARTGTWCRQSLAESGQRLGSSCPDHGTRGDAVPGLLYIAPIVANVVSDGQ